ncbi:S-layer homology domain-containing protein [Paenibacillus sp. 19GGS1-52]|nr:S-layer homology domain-containing protein [Paenibacillus sp. 19GGS1-52]
MTSMEDSRRIKVITVGMSSNGSFKEVPSSHWAKYAIDQAVAKGYFKGYSDGTFKPNSQVTRE